MAKPRRHGPVPDHVYSELLRDFIRNTVFTPQSMEARICDRVAHDGIRSLDAGDLAVWHERILPVVSKPLGEQVAVAKLLHNGGNVPRRIRPVPDHELRPTAMEKTMSDGEKTSTERNEATEQSTASRREQLLQRLTAAQRTCGNLDHDVKAGAALLSDEELEARVEEAEAVAKTDLTGSASR